MFKRFLLIRFNLSFGLYYSNTSVMECQFYTSESIEFNESLIALIMQEESRRVWVQQRVKTLTVV